MKDIQLFNDSFLNYKSYQIPKAQLILTDVPYVLGNKAYASNPTWYVGGDNSNGESDKAGKQFFSSDSEFRPAAKRKQWPWASALPPSWSAMPSTLTTGGKTPKAATLNTKPPKSTAKEL